MKTKIFVHFYAVSGIFITLKWSSAMTVLNSVQFPDNISEKQAQILKNALVLEFHFSPAFVCTCKLS